MDKADVVPILQAESELHRQDLGLDVGMLLQTELISIGQDLKILSLKRVNCSDVVFFLVVGYLDCAMERLYRVESIAK